jgi:hypothetical protein
MAMSQPATCRHLLPTKTQDRGAGGTHCPVFLQEAASVHGPVSLVESPMWLVSGFTEGGWSIALLSLPSAYRNMICLHIYKNCAKEKIHKPSLLPCQARTSCGVHKPSSSFLELTSQECGVPCLESRHVGQCSAWNALTQDRSTHALCLALSCQIPVAGSSAALQILDFHVSSGLQDSVRTVPPASNRMSTAAVLLGNKPMHVRMFHLRQIIHLLADFWTGQTSYDCHKHHRLDPFKTSLDDTLPTLAVIVLFCFYAVLVRTNQNAFFGLTGGKEKEA